MTNQIDQWDEKLRGPKMGKGNGKVIYKYQMPVSERFEMKLPANAEIIRMHGEGGLLWLWAVVDTNVSDEVRFFRTFKCGGSGMNDAGNLVYRGCAAIYIQAELMLYIFEELSND